MVIVGAGVRKTFSNTLVGILKVVFTNETDVDNFCSLFATLEEFFPWTKCRSWANRFTGLTKNGYVKTLILHVYWYFVDARKVLALNDTVEINVTECCDFLANAIAKVLLCAENQNVRLDTDTLQLLYGMLCRLGL